MTEFVYVKGKVKWFKHIHPDTYNNKSTWKHTLYPDAESLEKIRELQAEGMRNVLKKDEDGYYINFSRPTKITVKGQERLLDPPTVVLGDGKTQYPDQVGNGSDVTTKLEVYEHRVPGTTLKAKAARWLASRIDNLIPYTRDLDLGEHFTANDARAIKGFDKQAPSF